MKIIDLLNKIANGEEVPRKIYYSSLIFKWTGLNYYCEKVDEFLDNHICIEDLEQEVEIVKDLEHKIPKRIQSNGENLYSEYIGEWLVNTEKYTEYDELLMNKINEILDYLEEIE